MNVLTDLEKSWGGTIQERMDAKLAAYRAKKNLEKAMADKSETTKPEAGAGE